MLICVLTLLVRDLTIGIINHTIYPSIVAFANAIFTYPANVRNFLQEKKLQKYK